MKSRWICRFQGLHKQRVAGGWEVQAIFSGTAQGSICEGLLCMTLSVGVWIPDQETKFLEALAPSKCQAWKVETNARRKLCQRHSSWHALGQPDLR